MCYYELDVSIRVLLYEVQVIYLSEDLIEKLLDLVVFVVAELLVPLVLPARRLQDLLQYLQVHFLESLELTEHLLLGECFRRYIVSLFCAVFLSHFLESVHEQLPELLISDLRLLLLVGSHPLQLFHQRGVLAKLCFQVFSLAVHLDLDLVDLLAHLALVGEHVPLKLLLHLVLFEMQLLDLLLQPRGFFAVLRLVLDLGLDHAQGPLERAIKRVLRLAARVTGVLQEDELDVLREELVDLNLALKFIILMLKLLILLYL